MLWESNNAVVILCCIRRGLLLINFSLKSAFELSNIGGKILCFVKPLKLKILNCNEGNFMYFQCKIYTKKAKELSKRLRYPLVCLRRVINSNGTPPNVITKTRNIKNISLETKLAVSRTRSSKNGLHEVLETKRTKILLAFNKLISKKGLRAILQTEMGKKEADLQKKNK